MPHTLVLSSNTQVHTQTLALQPSEGNRQCSRCTQGVLVLPWEHTGAARIIGMTDTSSELI